MKDIKKKEKYPQNTKYIRLVVMDKTQIIKAVEMFQNEFNHTHTNRTYEQPNHINNAWSEELSEICTDEMEQKYRETPEEDQITSETLWEMCGNRCCTNPVSERIIK